MMRTIGFSRNQIPLVYTRILNTKMRGLNEFTKSVQCTKSVSTITYTQAQDNKTKPF